MKLYTDLTNHPIAGIAHQGNVPFRMPLISEILEGKLWMGGAFDRYFVTDIIIENQDKANEDKIKIPHGLDLTAFDLIIDVYGHGLEPKVRPDAELIVDRMSDWHEVEESQWDRARALAIKVADAVKSGKKVLVHCQAGLNRSGLVTSLALRELGYSSQEAINLLREKRCDAVLCNRTFENYLRGLDGVTPLPPYPVEPKLYS